MITRAPRLLVKARPIPRGTSFSIGKIPFRLEPLIDEGPARRDAAMGAAGAAVWHLTDAPADVDETDLWELCHQLRSKGLGLAGGPQVEFAEPDLEQQWVFDTPDRLAGKGFRATAAKIACERPDPADRRYPAPAPFDWRWFQDSTYSGLDAARSEIKEPRDRVTIAHLDTGYRKDHSVLPQFLDTKRQHNFVDANRPDDASDPGVGGFGNNPGHGTGTLSILAGSLFNGKPFGVPSAKVGGAPFAQVIPVRVANSVLLFTNSAIARGIAYATRMGADVLSMSMGGVPAQAWADMVNAAYEAGVTLVTAAGNNFGPGKLRVPRFIVWPARFGRVLAACGVMSNKQPYADFDDPRMMGGSYGPDSKMDTALAAYTPNTAWAKYACTGIVDFDGAGTSAATPQVAAAAACWLQKNRQAVLSYKEKWMRVAAVRQALFSSAQDGNREHFGRGTLRADRAMTVTPPAAAKLAKVPADSVGVPLLGPTLGTIFGVAEPTAEQRMLHIEAAQILARSGPLQSLLIDAGIDPDQPAPHIPGAVRDQFVAALADQPTASRALKAALQGTLRRQRPSVSTSSGTLPVQGETPTIPEPERRKLRVFAFDPALRMRVATESINETTLEVPWEADLKPGPVGEYLEVVDIDPASDACYAPVDLNHPHVLAANGLDPAEGVPQFHQQMVYAVAMTTIGRFERALGRAALWAPYMPKTQKNGSFKSYYVQRLRIFPHALREANAYYSPAKIALLFGYFQANREAPGDNLPGGLVFTSLSHDVVAHETTHALLDGLHRYYRNPTNDDIAAFHEAFADIVALFQHFTIPAALRQTIAKTRGELGKDNLLAQLAQQFGQASSGSVALRSALATPPKASDYAMATEPHDRGAVLLAAIFQAFLEIYEERVRDLKRLATGGTGVLPDGDISVDLVNRMAREAATAASHVLTTCIRALDYCPPVDLTFGDYLRALITADMDLEPEDALNYRTAFIAGFRARGIFPSGVRNLSEENLRWQPPSLTVEPDRIRELIKSLDLTWDLSGDRRQAFLHAESNGQRIWQWLQKNLKPAEARAVEADLGVYIQPGANVPKEIPLAKDGTPLLQIHSVRPARRTSSRGQHVTDLVIEAVQRFIVTDPNTQAPTTHRGGFTLLIDLTRQRLRYAVRKRVGSPSRIAAEQSFRGMAAQASQPYFDTIQEREPFAMLHRGE
jgi:hypothetical protein